MTVDARSLLAAATLQCRTTSTQAHGQHDTMNGELLRQFMREQSNYR
jgi:hypothetical protein